MRRRIRGIVIFCVTFFVYGIAQAELPVDIEGLLTDKGKFKFDLGLTYANTNRTDFSAGDIITVQVGPTQFISIPTRIGESRVNSDILIPNIGLRYGITADTEIYGKTTWIFDRSRVQDSSGFHERSDNRFNDAWMGINHRFIQESTSPALIGFGEISLAEKTNDSTLHGKAWQAGVTIYRTLDPVVIALTGSFQYRVKRKDGAETVSPGNLFVLNPQISFAVNEKVTLTSGLTWRNQSASSINSVLQSQRNTSTTLNLGFAYLWDKRTTLNLTSRSEVTGRGGTEIGLAVQIKLGDLTARRMKTSAHSLSPVKS